MAGAMKGAQDQVFHLAYTLTEGAGQQPGPRSAHRGARHPRFSLISSVFISLKLGARVPGNHLTVSCVLGSRLWGIFALTIEW
jgi:hypothetical protein